VHLGGFKGEEDVDVVVGGVFHFFLFSSFEKKLVEEQPAAERELTRRKKMI
jgi:hypothetical protein